MGGSLLSVTVKVCGEYPAYQLRRRSSIGFLIKMRMDPIRSVSMLEELAVAFSNKLTAFLVVHIPINITVGSACIALAPRLQIRSDSTLTNSRLRG